MRAIAIAALWWLAAATLSAGAEVQFSLVTSRVLTGNPLPRDIDGVNYFGVARLKAGVDAVKAEVGDTERVIHVMPGNFLGPSDITLHYKGHRMREYTRALNLEYSTVGVGDLLLGPDTLATFLDGSGLQMLSANMIFRGQTPLKPFIAGTAVREVSQDGGTVRVGFVGLTKETLCSLAVCEYTVALVSAKAALEGAVEKLRGTDGADVVVVLSAISEMAEELMLTAGVDVWISQIYEGSPAHPGADEVYSTLARSDAPGDHLHVIALLDQETVSEFSLARIDLTVATADVGGGLQSFAFSTPTVLRDCDVAQPELACSGVDETLEATVDEDLAAIGLVDAWVAESRMVMNNVQCRREECRIGSLIADSWTAAFPSDCDVGVQNAGGIRTELGVGNVTWSQVAANLPFGNTMESFQITGQHFIDALQSAYSRIGAVGGTGRFAQLSGARVKLDMSKPIELRVVEVEIRDRKQQYKALGLDDVLWVCTNNYIRGGGDGYTAFRDHARAIRASGLLLSQLLAQHMTIVSPIEESLESRISFVNPDDPVAMPPVLGSCTYTQEVAVAEGLSDTTFAGRWVDVCGGVERRSSAYSLRVAPPQRNVTLAGGGVELRSVRALQFRFEQALNLAGRGATVRLLNATGALFPVRSASSGDVGESIFAGQLAGEVVVLAAEATLSYVSPDTETGAGLNLSVVAHYDCPSGHAEVVAGGGSGGDSSSCEPCAPGHFLDEGSGACRECEAGTVAAGWATHGACEACPDGSFQAETGGSSCRLCSGGRVVGAGAGTCACPAGAYELPGEKTCQQCTGGRVVGEDGQSCSCLDGSWDGAECVQSQALLVGLTTAGALLVLALGAVVLVYRRNLRIAQAKIAVMTGTMLGRLDLDSPLTKAIDQLKQLQAQAGARSHGAFDDVIHLLVMSVGSDKRLFNPNLDRAAGDADTKDYVRQLLQHRYHENTGGAASRSRISVESYSRAAGRDSLAKVQHGRAPESLLSADVQEVLERDVDMWSFDLFGLEAMTGEHALPTMGRFLFHRSQLHQIYGIDDRTLDGWLQAMEAGYRKSNPYHNATHAADVLHAVAQIVFSPSNADNFTDHQVFVLLVAAIVHDLDHPGFTNNFLINARDDLALLYNDRSVLESHHVSLAFTTTLADPKINIFANFSDADFAIVRRDIIEAVMVTDISQHFVVVEKFKTQNSLGELQDLTTPDAQRLMNQIVLKLGDVSNPAKSDAIATKWTERIMDEFWSQGDVEKNCGTAVSMFMDRETTSVPKCQLGFINFIVSPLWTAASERLNLAEQMSNLQFNKDKWTRLLDKETQTAVPL